MDVLIYRHECRVPNSVCWPLRQVHVHNYKPARQAGRALESEHREEEEDHMARTLCPSEREVNIAKAYRAPTRTLPLISFSLSLSRISSRLSFRSGRLREGGRE